MVLSFVVTSNRSNVRKMDWVGGLYCNLTVIVFKERASPGAAVKLCLGDLLVMEWDDKEEGKEVTQQWEDDWDDDDVSDDFSLQLRRELESNTEKN
ncbi:hypothetical protein GmHk_06G016368 [Glycine max]|nr:hypothetical protein GmHk_06G016368 [Glycine max]